MGAFEGYITIATYNQAYVDFLYDVKTAQVAENFMRMTEYGPYDLRSTKELKNFLCDVVILMGNDAL